VAPWWSCESIGRHYVVMERLVDKE
ncbi:hypothetical protein L195_g039818, partial [Trifolium pratense]